ncbi:MAG: hypothetical protein FWD82_07165 [Defluviitaleaceae bacterium]|nr:hypothetical protein [Defluviitaleaceae bacterium]
MNRRINNEQITPERLKIMGIVFTSLAPFLGLLGAGLYFFLMPHMETGLEEAGIRFGALGLIVPAVGFLIAGLAVLRVANKRNNSRNNFM